MKESELHLELKNTNYQESWSKKIKSYNFKLKLSWLNNDPSLLPRKRNPPSWRGNLLCHLSAIRGNQVLKSHKGANKKPSPLKGIKQLTTSSNNWKGGKTKKHPPSRTWGLGMRIQKNGNWGYTQVAKRSPNWNPSFLIKSKKETRSKDHSN